MFTGDYTKADHEEWLARIFAAEYNRIAGTDYVVGQRPPEDDSIDAILLSLSRDLPEIKLQMRWAADGHRIRNRIRKEKLSASLQHKLISNGLKGIDISFFLGCLPPPTRMSDVVDLVAKLIIRALRQRPTQQEIEIEEMPPELEQDVGPSWILVHRLGGAQDGVRVDPMLADDVPDPGAIIRHSVEEKEKKCYSDAQSIFLLLQAESGAHTVETVARHLSAPLRSSFAQVWFIYPESATSGKIARIPKERSNLR